MKDELTLVILAAGMGSRFGGLKQVEAVGPNGEFIIDYSIYDAIKAGFNKVVFIIKEENYELFKNTIGKRIESKIKTEYAFQKTAEVPDFVSIPSSRVKPWGTGHALLAAESYINGPFAIIGADDFYGREAFMLLADFFKNIKDKNKHVTIGYKIKNTLSENGSVKRGLFVEENGKVKSFIESKIEKVDDKLIASPLMGKEPFEIDFDMPVSMIMFGFQKEIFKTFNEAYIKFFKENLNNLETVEFLVPEILEYGIKNNEFEVLIKKTNALWHGVTYKEDLADIRNAIKKYIEDGIYQNNLWN